MNLKKNTNSTWFKVPMKLIPINLKWSIAMICYKKLALNFKCTLQPTFDQQIFMIFIVEYIFQITINWWISIYFWIGLIFETYEEIKI